MKITYTVEADQNGYSLLVKQDGKTIHQSKHEATDTGCKKVSGTDEDDIEDDDLREAVESFLPFDLFLICSSSQ